MTTGGGKDETRRYGRAAGLLSAGIAVGGLLIYAYFALASHSLSADEYGRLVVLWLAVVVIVSVLFRPIEQLLARTVAEARARGAEDGRSIRVAGAIASTLALAFVAVAFAAREPLQDDLFSGDSTLFFVLVGAVLVYGVDFFTRGVVAGRGQFHLYATLLIAYGVMFVAFATVVALDLGPGFHFLAVGIAVSPLVGLTIVLLALVLGHRRSAGSKPAQAARGPGAARATLASGTGFAAAVLVVMVSEQVLINAGPLIVRGSEGAAAAGFIFNVVMIARAPIALFQGVAASLLPHLTRLNSSGREVDIRAFQSSMRATIVGVVAFTGITLAVVLAAGPQLMQAAFGDDFEYARGDLVIVAAGTGLFLAAATLNQSALARGQSRLAAGVWGLTAAAFLVFNALPIMDAQMRVEVGFSAAAGLVCVALFVLYRRPGLATEDGLQPGSPDELQARLAAAEEGA